jgi:hypothetical protein
LADHRLDHRDGQDHRRDAVEEAADNDLENQQRHQRLELRQAKRTDPFDKGTWRGVSAFAYSRLLSPPQKGRQRYAALAALG